MTELVVDASAFLECILRTDIGRRVRGHIHPDDVALHAPALCDVEVVSGLRRALRSGLLDVDRLSEAMEDYLDLPVRIHMHRWLLGRALELRQNLTAYDASSAALAELLGARLLTADGRLARAARAHARCEVVDL